LRHYLTTTSVRPDSFVTRVKNAVAFVCIVWAVAATFIAFDLVSGLGMDVVLSNPGVFGNRALSNATRRSVTCDVGTDEKTRGDVGSLSAADARVGSWLLGLKIGRDAQARQSATVTPPVLAASGAGVEQVAAMLRVPPPGAFMPRQMAQSNTEFVSFIEADARGTAHRLAVGYSAQACYLFKFGAFWGYSTLSRFLLPGEGSVYAAEIDHYGREAGVPEPLWRPMVQPTSKNASAAQINEQSTQLTDGVNKYLAAGQ
jgi:hypothetical protein